jgi:aryl-alcohol dehydrogenase-like predicted oxidoreductase
VIGLLSIQKEIDMEYLNLGKSGLKVSRICLGMMSYGTPEWRDYILTEEESRPIIKRALELGVNFFDTADMYSLGVSEEVTGRALSDYARRDDVVLATKTYWPMSDDVNDRGLSRKHIMQAIDNSLRRLGTDYVDLFYIHRWDYETPIEETMEALHDVVRAGKALYIGASSMFAWQFAKAQYTADLHGWTRFVAMQNHMNLIYREEEREMVPLCIDQGVGIAPWSPLARGFLAGNRTREKEGTTTRAKTDTLAQEYYFQSGDFNVLDRAIQVAENHGVKPAQIALAWLLNKPGITAPIVGASKMSHLEEAVAAVEIELSDEEMAFLEEPYQAHPILGHE